MPVSPFPKHYTDAVWSGFSENEHAALSAAEAFVAKNKELTIFDESINDIRNALLQHLSTPKTDKEKLNGVGSYEIAVRSARITPEEFDTVLKPYENTTKEIYERESKPNRDVAAMSAAEARKTLEDRFNLLMGIMSIKELLSGKEERSKDEQKALERIERVESHINRNLAKNFAIPVHERDKAGVSVDVNRDGRIDEFEIFSKGLQDGNYPSLNVNADRLTDRKDIAILQNFKLSPSLTKRLGDVVKMIEEDPALFSGSKKEITTEDRRRFDREVINNKDMAFRMGVLKAVIQDPTLVKDLRELVDANLPEKQDLHHKLQIVPHKEGGNKIQRDGR